MKQDTLAGISVAGLLLPLAIAYALIAGLPPDHAIIATIVGLGIYALAGRSRLAIVAHILFRGHPGGGGTRNATKHARRHRDRRRGHPCRWAVFPDRQRIAGRCLGQFCLTPGAQWLSIGIVLKITIKQIPEIAAITLHANGAGRILPVVWHLIEAVPQFHIESVLLGALALSILPVLRRFRGFPASALVLSAGALFSALVNLANPQTAVSPPNRSAG